MVSAAGDNEHGLNPTDYVAMKRLYARLKVTAAATIVLVAVVVVVVDDDTLQGHFSFRSGGPSTSSSLFPTD